VYPDLQLHSNDPGLFTQSDLDEQLLASGVLHSSTSAKESVPVIFSLEHVDLQIFQTNEVCNVKEKKQRENNNNNNNTSIIFQF